LFSRPQATFEAIPAWRSLIEFAGVIAFIGALLGVWYTYAAVRLTGVALEEERRNVQRERKIESIALGPW
jgi:hypothetical protein